METRDAGEKANDDKWPDHVMIHGPETDISLDSTGLGLGKKSNMIRLRPHHLGAESSSLKMMLAWTKAIAVEGGKK